MALLAGTRGPSSQRGSWDAACARTYTRSSRGMKCSDYVMLVLIPNPEPTAPPPGQLASPPCSSTSRDSVQTLGPPSPCGSS